MTDESKMVVIGCVHSAGVARDGLQEIDKALPDYVEWVDVPCGGSVDDLLILRALEHGAERVLVLVCNDGACRSLDGSRWAQQRGTAARALLEEIGIAPWRVQVRPIGPNMSADLLAWIAAFTEPVSEAAE